MVHWMIRMDYFFVFNCFFYIYCQQLSVCLVLGVLAAVANAESAAVASAPRDKRQILGAILGSLLGGGGHGKSIRLKSN
jgi:hypothetical protein